MVEGEWRIDAMDARGGLAFASRRADRFSELETRAQDPLCAFIGAPGFQPEMVASRSIALAGVRGAFQYRLFIDEEEVAFPSLAGVTEFVRRVYLRGGGGDGAGGVGGEGPPPILPDGGPDLPGSLDLEEESGGLARSMVDAVMAFKGMTALCKPGTSIQFRKWPDSRGQELAKHGIMDGPTILANAATRLIYEMVRRIPNGQDLAATVRWHRNARTLGAMIAAMGLWDILLREPHYGALVRLLGALKSWKSKLTALQATAGSEIFDVMFLCALIFGSGPALDDEEGAWRHLRTIEYWWHRPFPVEPLQWQDRALDESVDPVTSLCRIPVPKDVAAVVRNAANDDIGLYHVLVSIVGAPLLGHSQKHGFFEFVLFAATWIAGCNGTPGSHGFVSEYPQRPLSLIRAAEVQIKLNRGWNWLRAHMPTMCFPPEVETAIEAAADLKYGPSAGSPIATLPQSPSAKV
ncbi:hypothetical protein [Bradyrhizobium quebecense]|uniref:Uncharacterized protein n=2 Tax=Bradyrhizobium quebecense TaxID=2748629 RepID=A0ACD3V824_9BRAD|nr:hypothetical protein [Bradyrhizobium quebecense]UGY02524.1 hypothetical protein J4P68_0036495 [Bradyrhizobium quebecense]